MLRENWTGCSRINMRDSKTKRYDESLVEHIRTVQSYKNATAKPTEHAKEAFRRKPYETKRSKANGEN